MRVHPFPFRTRKLSSSVATILGWRRPGKIARRQHKDSSCENAAAVFFARRQPSPNKRKPEAEFDQPAYSNRSGSFDWKRRSDRMQASHPGAYETGMTKPMRSTTTTARRQHKDSSCENAAAIFLCTVHFLLPRPRRSSSGRRSSRFSANSSSVSSLGMRLPASLPLPRRRR